jgi:NhaP-type Na+/H+ or K+/H+ antiporter
MPTLGAGMMVNRAVQGQNPAADQRRDGLNDEIATPFVLVAIAGAATAEHAVSTGPGAAVAELALGLLIGAAVGGGGGWLVKVARGRGWVAEGSPAITGLSTGVWG